LLALATIAHAQDDATRAHTLEAQLAAHADDTGSACELGLIYVRLTRFDEATWRPDRSRAPRVSRSPTAFSRSRVVPHPTRCLRDWSTGTLRQYLVVDE